MAGTTLGGTAAFDAGDAARALTAALRSLGTPERAVQEKRYLKSDLEFPGVTVPDIRRAVRAGALRHASDLGDAAAWPRIDGWASDADFWVRRPALLALLPGIRSGQPDLARFTAYAEPLLAERECFIRKAIGWVLGRSRAATRRGSPGGRKNTWRGCRA